MFHYLKNRTLNLNILIKIHILLNRIFSIFGINIRSKVSINSKVDRLVEILRRAKNMGVPKDEIKQVIEKEFSAFQITITGLDSLIDNVYGGDSSAR